MNEPVRQNPDVLLASIQRNEQAKLRGTLKIFFGMCAGVGKTYAMLKAGQALKARDISVSVGIVETHGRKETEELLSGLPVIPRLYMDYKGKGLIGLGPGRRIVSAASVCPDRRARTHQCRRHAPCQTIPGRARIA